MKLKKDPNAKLDYTFNWEPWLDGDSIASVQWLVSGGIVVESSTFSATKATAFVSGGVVGGVAELTCRVTTANVTPRIDDRTLFLQIVER